jgi:hypothetical protein
MRSDRPAEIGKRRRLDQKLAAAAGVILPSHFAAAFAASPQSGEFGYRR